MTSEYSVDKTAVATISVLGFVVWPAVIGATLWKLGIFDPASMSGVNIGVAIGTVFVGILPLRQIVQQFRGALGVTISEEGITTRRGKITWPEVTAVEKPSFGTLVVKAGDREITLQTYLFAGRDRLEKFVDEHAPG